MGARSIAALRPPGRRTVIPPRARASGPQLALAALLAVLYLHTATPPARAQEADGGPILEGRVLRSGDPLADATVGLHRVTPSQAGQIDSVGTGQEGSFRFVLPAVPGAGPESEVYFASVRHHGVLYFGPAINEPTQLDSLYRIEVHDTVAAPAGGQRFPIVARNLLLEDSETGWTIVDLFRLRNDRERTVVAPEGEIVWSHPLPPSARDFQPGESDLAPDAVTFDEGTIRVFSPVPPGERTFLMRYEVPELPVTIPVGEGTERLEMLVREPAPPLTVAGMERLAPVEIEPGSNYRRFAAAEPEVSAVEIAEGEEGSGGEVAWIAIILAMVLAGATLFYVQRSPRAAEHRQQASTRSELLVRVAELDDAFEGQKDLPERERKRYRAERERLLSRLRDLE